MDSRAPVPGVRDGSVIDGLGRGYGFRPFLVVHSQSFLVVILALNASSLARDSTAVPTSILSFDNFALLAS